MSKQLREYSVVLFDKLNDYDKPSKTTLVKILKADGFIANKGATIFVHPKISGAFKISKGGTVLFSLVIEII